MATWKYGMVLKRNKSRVMFVRYDAERARMMGGGIQHFVGIRLDNNDRTNPHYHVIGAQGNYTGSGWKLDE